MPHHKSCIKRIKQSEKAQERNNQMKSRIRSAVKKISTAKDQKEATESIKEAYSIFDKAVKLNVIHKNKAANHKSKITKMVKTLPA